MPQAVEIRDAKGHLVPGATARDGGSSGDSAADPDVLSVTNKDVFEFLNAFPSWPRDVVKFGHPQHEKFKEVYGKWMSYKPEQREAFLVKKAAEKEGAAAAPVPSPTPAPTPSPTPSPPPLPPAPGDDPAAAEGGGPVAALQGLLQGGAPGAPGAPEQPGMSPGAQGWLEGLGLGLRRG